MTTKALLTPTLTQEEFDAMQDKLDGIIEFVKMLNYDTDDGDSERGWELIGKTKRDWMKYWTTHTIPEGIPLNPQLEYKPVFPGWGRFMGADYAWWSTTVVVREDLPQVREKRWAPDFDVMGIYNKWKENKRKEANEDLQYKIFNFVNLYDWDEKTRRCKMRYGITGRVLKY